MIKYLANKILTKRMLYTFFMEKVTPIQNHIDEFNSIIIYLEILDVKFEDEDKVVLLVVSLAFPMSTLRKSYYKVPMILYLLRT